MHQELMLSLISKYHPWANNEVCTSVDRVLVESAERRERRANLELLDLPEDEEDQETTGPKETQYENRTHQNIHRLPHRSVTTDLFTVFNHWLLISGSCWFPWWSRPPWWGWTQSKCRFWMIHVYLFAEMLNVAPQLPTVQFSLFAARLSFVLNRTTQRKPLTSSSLFLGPGWCQGRERRGRRSRRTCE